MKTFLIQKYFYSNSKKCKQDKKKEIGTNFDLTADS